MQARVAYYEAAAVALEQRRDLDVRNTAAVTEQHCERAFQALRSENDALASRLRSAEAKTAQSASEEQILKTAVQNAIADLQNQVAERERRIAELRSSADSIVERE